MRKVERQVVDGSQLVANSRFLHYAPADSQRKRVEKKAGAPVGMTPLHDPSQSLKSCPDSCSCGQAILARRSAYRKAMTRSLRSVMSSME